MKMTKFVTALMATIMTVTSTTSFAANTPKEKRKPQSLEAPPQFVLLAFDGSLSLDFWQESLAFADTVSTTNNRGERTKIKFTYFVNPPYYLDSAKKAAYQTPRLNKPVSCIGWANGRETIVPRIDWTNRAFLQGHEIGSHANSHCDQSGTDKTDPLFGRPWGLADWSSEFKQFNDIFFNLFKINGLKPSAANPKGFSFTQKDIVGFRAPKLAYTPEMWPALKNFGFRYDTSKSSPPTYWPQRHPTAGIWNFPLGVIKIAGTNKSTYSMDYNWLCRQSACVTKANLTETERLKFKNQMLDSYKYYFKINYFGGRGPIHIGHHFSKWNKGAYWEAMQDFAKFVCTKPEVRCVTYKEYADWLDSQPKDRLEAYRAGNFNKLRDDNTIKNISTPVLADVRLEHDPEALTAVVDVENKDRLAGLGWKTQLSINFEAIPGEAKISRENLIAKIGLGKSALIRASIINRSGHEVNWETRKIENLGLAEETWSEPIENLALQGESAEAHNTPE